MSNLESILFWLAIGIYAVAAGVYVYALIFNNDRVLSKLIVLTCAGLVAHSAAIAARYAAQGHLPWAGDYENGLMGGWFIVFFTVLVGGRRKDLQIIAVATLPLTVLMMGFGVMRNPTLGPLAASLKSVWLFVHVYFAWIAYGAYALAFSAGIILVLKQRNAQKPIYQKLPSLDRLDDLIFRYIAFGFITHAVMIASGAIWAKDLWGNYWSWDPVETWSLVSWLLYGLIIHLRMTLGWRGTRIAWLAILAILGMVITFFGVTFVVKSSLHIFDVR